MDDRGEFGQVPAPPFADVAEALGLGMVYQIAVTPEGAGSHRCVSNALVKLRSHSR